MSFFFRRVRGAVVLALLWAPAWAVVGVALGLRHMINSPPQRTHAWELPIFFGALLGVAGVLGGLGFAALLAVASRGRHAEALPAVQVAVLGALPGFGLGALLEPGYVGAALLALVGAGCAVGSVRLAGRAGRAPRDRAASREVSGRGDRGSPAELMIGGRAPGGVRRSGGEDAPPG